MTYLTNAELEVVRAEKRGRLATAIAASARVIAECKASNGALLEAPARGPVNPRGRSGIPRCLPGADLAMTLLASDVLGEDVRPNLLPWLIDTAEHASSGLLAMVYWPDGTVADGTPDLGGSMLLLTAVCRNLQSEAARQVAGMLAPAITCALPLDPGYREGETDVWGGLLGTLPHGRHSAVDELISHLLSTRKPRPYGVGREDLSELGPVLCAALEPRWSLGGDRKLLSHLFYLAVAFTCMGEHEFAPGTMYEGLEFADSEGYLPEGSEMLGDAQNPTPYLLSHVLFVYAAYWTGELAFLPKSTSDGRRS